MTLKTHTPKMESRADKKWFLVDAEGKTLGRLATQVAVILRGKSKPAFAPHLDMGDYVVVINADKIRLTGQKEDQKEYIHHTGYLGHLRRKSMKDVRAKNPTRIVEEAVAGMVPRNRLKKFIMEKLKVYAGTDHPHGGQKLEPLSI
ncbi:50S ribosomal protein L13 [Patescibacteria group bacterium]|nr:50S ribosomal protein L13 [Patescibacteria group bacterium]